MENVKMGAIEFIKERERMCYHQYHTEGRCGCNDCVIQEFRSFISGKSCFEQCEQFESDMPELFVQLVKQWSDEHPVVTNADAIRRMTDEDLAAIIMCPHDGDNDDCDKDDSMSCIECSLEWLKSEVKNEIY